MKTEQILLTLAIAREKSINRAAESLFISQPTASNMLKSLETELGYPLFRRMRSGMVLTEKGTQFVEYAAEIERSMKAIRQIGAQEQQRTSFHIISVKYGFAEQAFETLCGKYCSDDAHAVDFSFRIVGPLEESSHIIESGQADLAIMMCSKKLYEASSYYAVNQRLDFTFLCEMPLELTCRRDHPIIRNGAAAFDLFSKYPCISSIHASNWEFYAPNFLSKHGICFQNCITTDPTLLRYRLLQMTDAYLISARISEELKAAYDLVSVPLEDFTLSLVAVFHKNSPKEALINEYIQYCRDCVEKHTETAMTIGG